MAGRPVLQLSTVPLQGAVHLCALASGTVTSLEHCSNVHVTMLLWIGRISETCSTALQALCATPDCVMGSLTWCVTAAGMVARSVVPTVLVRLSLSPPPPFAQNCDVAEIRSNSLDRVLFFPDRIHEDTRFAMAFPGYLVPLDAEAVLVIDGNSLGDGTPAADIHAHAHAHASGQDQDDWYQDAEVVLAP